MGGWRPGGWRLSYTFLIPVNTTSSTMQHVEGKRWKRQPLWTEGSNHCRKTSFKCQLNLTTRWFIICNTQCQQIPWEEMGSKTTIAASNIQNRSYLRPNIRATEKSWAKGQEFVHVGPKAKGSERGQNSFSATWRKLDRWYKYEVPTIIFIRS